MAAAARLPIHRLWEHLRRGRPFPSCATSDGSNIEAAGAYLRYRYTYYDPCPSGTTDLAVGMRAASTRQVQGQLDAYGRGGATVSDYVTGIGTGEGITPGYRSEGASALPPKVCVGTKTGLAYAEEPDAQSSPRRVPADVYDHVVLLAPNASPRVIDVYVDNTLYRRVRW